MKWELDKSRAICPQICEQLCVGIASGELTPGSKLLSVREVALSAGVNPNTVQKSFEELERLGVIHSVRCSGWYVNKNTDAAKKELEFLRVRKTEEYLAAMSLLGCAPDEIVNLINEHLGGKNE